MLESTYAEPARSISLLKSLLKHAGQRQGDKAALVNSRKREEGVHENSDGTSDGSGGREEEGR